MEQCRAYQWLGLSIRAAGVGLLLIAWAAATGMSGAIAADPRADPIVLEMLLGFVLFGAGSLGSAMLLLGRHLLDRVVVSDKWSRLPRSQGDRS
ncbi:hypothetical protein BH10PSE12_BH10PSE12_22070 [soil metagenome]